MSNSRLLGRTLAVSLTRLLGAGPTSSWDSLFSPCVWRTLYSEVFRDSDGQNEVSIILGGKEACIPILTLTYPIPCLSLAGLPAYSFIHYIYTEPLLYA